MIPLKVTYFTVSDTLVKTRGRRASHQEQCGFRYLFEHIKNEALYHRPKLTSSPSSALNQKSASLDFRADL